MFFYESYRDIDDKVIKNKSRNLNYGKHIHRSFELLYCDGGQMTVKVGETEYEMHNGTSVLIPPDTPHSYKTQIHSSVYVFVFSDVFIKDFASHIYGKALLRNLFYLSPVLKSMLLELFQNELSFLGTKAVLYRVIDECMRNNELKVKPQNKKDELTLISDYLRQNFTKDITLVDLAENLGFNYHYASHLVQKTFGVSFSRLLADFRISYAKHLLEGDFKSYSEIGFLSGFKSVRNFNRVFKEFTGYTPKKYHDLVVFDF